MTTETKDKVELPGTAPYRVVIAAAAYDSPRLDYDREGKARVIYVRDFGLRGQEVALVPREAQRLEALGAVRSAGAPKGYDEMNTDELKALATSRGLTVRSSGADPDIPLDDDYRNALALFDQGADAGAVAVGVGTTPGGIDLQASGQGTAPVRLEQPPSLDVTVSQLAERIGSEKLNASDTVDLAQGYPVLAAQVLEAEKLAQGGDPRATVAAPLQKLIDGA